MNSDTVEIKALIYHINGSKAEGKPARIRAMLPRYVKYVTDSSTKNDSFLSNYSLPTQSPHSNEPVDVVAGTEGTYVDFIFKEGILFPDVIELNFTVTVDPDFLIPVGRGEEDHAIVLTAVCDQEQIHGYPADDSKLTSCGEMYTEPMKTDVAECYDIITITQDCQITANEQLSDDFAPKYANATDRGKIF